MKLLATIVLVFVSTFTFSQDKSLLGSIIKSVTSTQITETFNSKGGGGIYNLLSPLNHHYEIAIERESREASIQIRGDVKAKLVDEYGHSQYVGVTSENKLNLKPGKYYLIIMTDRDYSPKYNITLSNEFRNIKRISYEVFSFDNVEMSKHGGSGQDYSGRSRKVLINFTKGDLYDISVKFKGGYGRMIMLSPSEQSILAFSQNSGYYYVDKASESGLYTLYIDSYKTNEDIKFDLLISKNGKSEPILLNIESFSSKGNWCCNNNTHSYEVKLDKGIYEFYTEEPRTSISMSLQSDDDIVENRLHLENQLIFKMKRAGLIKLNVSNISKIDRDYEITLYGSSNLLKPNPDNLRKYVHLKLPVTGEDIYGFSKYRISRLSSDSYENELEKEKQIYTDISERKIFLKDSSKYVVYGEGSSYFEPTLVDLTNFKSDKFIVDNIKVYNIQDTFPIRLKHFVSDEMLNNDLSLHKYELFQVYNILKNNYLKKVDIFVTPTKTLTFNKVANTINQYFLYRGIDTKRVNVRISPKYSNLGSVILTFSN